MSATAARWAKTISTFQPLAGLDPEECDRYYREVHTRFARGFLREKDNVVSYHVARAEAGYDLNGGWLARPQAFRYITLRYQQGTGLGLSPALARTISQDHRLFLRELRGFAVEEEVLLDRLSGQTSLEKYVVEYDRTAHEPAGEAAVRLTDQLSTLTRLAGEAFGLRLLVLDRVTVETGSEPIDQPGQRSTGQPLPETTRQAFVELYFDQRQWAEEWFAHGDVRAAVVGEGWERVTAVRVREECGLDRR